MLNKKITIKYDGEYPHLCSGNLEVQIDGVCYKFPKYCLESGGYVSFHEEWNDGIGSRGIEKWRIEEWPENFPEELKEITLEEINNRIPWGCCGGCI